MKSERPEFEEYLEEMEIEIRQINQKIAELQAQKKQLQEEFFRAQDTYRKFCERYDLEPKKVYVDDDLRQKFQGLSVRECLVVIAKENNGILNSFDARQILLRGGVFRDDASASRGVYPVLSRANDFEKTHERGIYKYIHYKSAYGNKVANLPVSPQKPDEQDPEDLVEVI